MPPELLWIAFVLVAGAGTFIFALVGGEGPAQRPNRR